MTRERQALIDIVPMIQKIEDGACESYPGESCCRSCERLGERALDAVLDALAPYPGYDRWKDPPPAVRAALAALEELAPDKTPMWFPEEDLPINSGWYAVQRQDGSLCLRAFGNDEWWIPLKDGWLSGLPSGFRWMGPLAPIEWDTPRSDDETGRAPRAEEGT